MNRKNCSELNNKLKFRIEVVKLIERLVDFFGDGPGAPPTGLSPVCDLSFLKENLMDWLKSFMDWGDSLLPDF